MEYGERGVRSMMFNPLTHIGRSFCIFENHKTYHEIAASDQDNFLGKKEICSNLHGHVRTR